MTTSVIGFIFGALTIGAFALSANRAYLVVGQRDLKLFTTAFELLAVSMLCWGAGVVFHDSFDLKYVLFLTDCLLLLATGCMALLLIDEPSITYNVSLGIIGAVGLTLRAFLYPPAGFVRDGLLYFNLTGGVRTVVLLAFVVVWLPGMIAVSRRLARDKAFAAQRGALTNSFIALILTTGLFLSARRASVIIGLFVIVSVLFALMTVINLSVIKFHNTLERGKHVA